MIVRKENVLEILRRTFDMRMDSYQEQLESEITAQENPSEVVAEWRKDQIARIEQFLKRLVVDGEVSDKELESFRVLSCPYIREDYSQVNQLRRAIERAKNVYENKVSFVNGLKDDGDGHVRLTTAEYNHLIGDKS